MRRAGRILVLVGTLLVLTGSGLAQASRPQNVTRDLSPILVSLSPSVTTIVLPCQSNQVSSAGNCPANASTDVKLTTITSDPKHDGLGFIYKVDAGRIIGAGANVVWALVGVGPGTYTASVERYDGFGGITAAATMVTISNCPDCVPSCGLCPSVLSSCPDEVDQGQAITFTSMVGPGVQSPAYKWTVSAGTISSGQGTSSITVSTGGLGAQSVTATLEVGGMDASCARTTSCTTAVRSTIEPPRKFDEYGDLRFRDEKARLDNFAIQLTNEPDAVGYITGYGTCTVEGVTRARRARDYVVKTHGLDAKRVVVIDGGCLTEVRVDLWIWPLGWTMPQPETIGAIKPCPICKSKASRQRESAGRRK